MAGGGSDEVGERDEDDMVDNDAVMDNKQA